MFTLICILSDVLNQTLCEPCRCAICLALGIAGSFKSTHRHVCDPQRLMRSPENPISLSTSIFLHTHTHTMALTHTNCLSVVLFCSCTYRICVKRHPQFPSLRIIGPTSLDRCAKVQRGRALHYPLCEFVSNVYRSSLQLHACCVFPSASPSCNHFVNPTTSRSMNFGCIQG